MATQEKFLKINQVMEVTGLSKSEIYKRVKLGTFPKQIKLSFRSIVWVESEIQLWIQETIASARGAS